MFNINFIEAEAIVSMVKFWVKEYELLMILWHFYRNWSEMKSVKATAKYRLTYKKF